MSTRMRTSVTIRVALAGGVSSIRPISIVLCVLCSAHFLPSQGEQCSPKLSYNNNKTTSRLPADLNSFTMSELKL